MSEEVVSQISATVEKSVETASDTALRVGRAGLVAASAALSEALAPVAAKASEVYASARASAAELEEVAAVRAHSLLDAAAEAPGAAAGASLTLLALALPSSRRFLYRQTIGRLRSDAALAASAASRATALRGTVYEQQKEVAKLAERVLLASDEYTRGRSKLIAAGGQLRALGRAARASERRAHLLAADTRYVKRGVAGVEATRTSAYEAAQQSAAQGAAVARLVRRVAGVVAF